MIEPTSFWGDSAIFDILGVRIFGRLDLWPFFLDIRISSFNDTCVLKVLLFCSPDTLYFIALLFFLLAGITGVGREVLLNHRRVCLSAVRFATGPFFI